MLGSRICRELFLSAPVALLLLAGCSPHRISQTLPPIPIRSKPITVEIWPSDYPNEGRIPRGLMLDELSSDTPLERLSAVIRAGFEASGSFRVLERGPRQSRSDAEYLLRFGVDEMASERTRAGEWAQMLELEKNEYASVSLHYRLFDNRTDEVIETEGQVVDAWLIPGNPRLRDTLDLEVYFEKTARENIPVANATMRAVQRLAAATVEAVQRHEAVTDTGRTAR